MQARNQGGARGAKKFHRAVFEIWALKAEIKGVFSRSLPTCSPVVGQFFDTMIVASIDKEWL